MNTINIIMKNPAIKTPRQCERLDVGKRVFKLALFNGSATPRKLIFKNYFYSILYLLEVHE